MMQTDFERRDFDRAVEIVRGGFVTPHRLTGATGKLSGCVYRADGGKVAFSERAGGHVGDLFISDNPMTVPFPQDASLIQGRGLYLGHDMGGHYGHFLTEGLSSFWVFEEFPAANFDYFVLHPFVFGQARPDYVQYCLQKFGISEEKILVVGAEPLVFDELTVPERLFRPNHSADPRLRSVYTQIADGHAVPAGASSRVYVSRRRFSRLTLSRVVANEVWVEQLFQKHGFDVLYPDDIPFVEELARIRNAEVIAGMSGSGLHNCLFMREGCVVLELGDPRYMGKPSPTQALCNTVAGVSSIFIPFSGKRFGLKETLLFDIGFLRSELESAEAAGLPPARSGTGSVRADFDLLAPFEVLYLALRPSAGKLARNLIELARARVWGARNS